MIKKCSHFYRKNVALSLAAIRMQEISVGDHKVQNIPIPSKIAQQVLIETSIKLPKTLPMIDADVYTNKKLPKKRKRQ